MASFSLEVPRPPYLGESSEILKFKQLSDESLKEARDRLLEMQARANPKCHIKLLLRSFYVGLSFHHRYVLDLYLREMSLGIMLFTLIKI